MLRSSAHSLLNAMERRAFVIVLTEPALLLSNRCHVDSDGAGLRAILPAVARQVRDFGVHDLILARHAGDVRTGAANPASLHDGRLSSGLRPCQAISFPAAPLPRTRTSNCSDWGMCSLVDHGRTGSPVRGGGVSHSNFSTVIGRSRLRVPVA